MTGSAKLVSVDTVQRLAVAMRRFAEDAGNALADLELQVNRALQWIQHEQRDYWRDQVRRGWEDIAAARVALERKNIFREAGERPSRSKEQEDLDSAKRRLRIAQEKVELVKHWGRVVEREAIEFRGAMNQMSGRVQIDVPRSIALLDRMTRALEHYLSVTSLPDASIPWSSLLASSEEKAAGETASEAASQSATQGATNAADAAGGAPDSGGSSP